MKFCLDGKLFDSPEEAGIDDVNNEQNSPLSVFETIRTYNCKDLFEVEEHLKRLFKSDEILNLSSTVNIENIKTALNEVVKVNALSDSDLRIKILLIKDSFWIYTQPLEPPPEEIYTEGVEVRSETFQRPNPEAKYPNPNYRKFRELLDGNEFEIIFFDKDGNLREGNISNVFVVFGNTVVTPEKVLCGVTRAKVMELIKEDTNLNLEVRDIHKDQLEKADAIFLTNTTKEIVPVKKWGGWENDDFTVAQRLRKRFKENIDQRTS